MNRWVFVLLCFLAACRESTQGTKLAGDPDSPTHTDGNGARIHRWTPKGENFVQVREVQSRNAAFADLRRVSSRAQTSDVNSDRRAIFGDTLLGTGNTDTTPRELADYWIREFGSSLGVSDLVVQFESERRLRGGSRRIYTYQQWIQGYEVEGSLLKIQAVLQNNEWSVNYVSGILAPLPEGSLASIEIEADELTTIVRSEPIYQDYSPSSSPKLVVFYPFDRIETHLPRLAWRIGAKNSQSVVRTFFIDANTGSILFAREDTPHLNASGTVDGYVTPGVLPDTSSNPTELVPLENLYVSSSAHASAVDLTDANGDYSITHAAAAPNTVTANLLFFWDTGSYVSSVYDASLGSAFVDLSTVINANSTGVDFRFNSDPTEIETAQVNAFYNVQLAYRYFQDRVTISDLDSQEVASLVNDSAIPCNAQYIPDADNTDPAFLRFNVETDDCRNSAYSTVIAHEYGHHVVNRLGLTQLAFGEGFGDTLAMLLYDTPGVGLDFQKDDDYLREPRELALQFPCESSDIYVCAQLLSGFFWSLRQKMDLSDLQDLHVDWAALTAGGATPTGVSVQNALHPTTIVEILTADDDDGDLENGTPHQEEICETAEEFGLVCPVLLNFDFGSDLPKVIPPSEVVTMTVTVASGLGSPQDDTAYIFYRIDGGEWVSLALTSTGSNTYTFDFPVLSEGQRLEYYFVSDTTNGATAYYGYPEYFIVLGENPADVQVKIKVPKDILDLYDPQNGTATSSGKIFGVGDSIVSMTSTNLSNRDVIISKLPEGVSVSSASLFFYGTEATSGSFIFTNASRTRVYYGSNVSGNIAIDPKFCGDFQSISAIHLTETAVGVASRIIVADEGAGRLYSYAIDTSDSSLCISENSIPLTGVKWLHSDSGASPQNLYVGYQELHSLWVQKLTSTTLGVINGGIEVSNTPGNSFGEVAGLNSISNLGYLPIPVKGANSSTRGSDFLALFDTSFAFTSVATCRTPDRVRFDHANDRAYVLCRTARYVDVYDLSSQTKIARYPAGNRAKDLYLYTNSGTDLHLIVTQTDSKIVQINTTLATPTTYTNYTVTMPSSIDSIAGWNESGVAALLIRRLKRIYSYSLTSRTAATTYYAIPDGINDIAAQSTSDVHFVSSKVNRAYTLGQVNSENFRLRQYIVGTNPIKIGWRTNRLYVLNRNSNNLSIVNLTAAPLSAVTNVSTQTRPVHFDFNTTVDQLWVVNAGSNSMTTINIASGGSEGNVVANTALGFSPALVDYVHATVVGSRTIYVAGASTVRVINQSDRATVRTATLSKRVSRLFEAGTAVGALSVDGLHYHLINRSTTTTTNLDYSPQFGVYDSTTGSVVIASPNSQRIIIPGSTSFSVRPFNSFFSTSTHFAWYDTQRRELRLSPFGLINATALNSFALELAIHPDFGSNATANLWLADSADMSFQLIDSNLEPIRILNKLRNRPVDLAVSTDRVYIALKNNDSVFEYDPADGDTFAYPTCAGPEQIIYEPTADSVFVRCAEGNSIHALDAEDGTIASSEQANAGAYPVSMSINPTDDLIYVAARDSEDVRIFQTDLDVVATLDMPSQPSAVFADTSGAYVAIPSDREFQFINTSNALGTAISSQSLGMSQITRAGTDLFAMSRTPSYIYTNDETYSITSGTSNLVDRSPPASIESISGFAITSHPAVDAVRVYTFSTNRYRDIAVGADPRNTHSVAAESRTYVANYDDDSISVINLSTYAVIDTIDLTPGCRPTKMTNLVVSSDRMLYVICDQLDLLEQINVEDDDNIVGIPIPLRVHD